MFHAGHAWRSQPFPRLSLLSLLCLLFVFPPLAAQEEEDPVHHLTSESCKTCHAEIYRQWKSSVHARSTALDDPIHALFYRMVIGDPTAEQVKDKKGNYPVCLQCHAPNAARDGKSKLDTRAAYAEGVNCMVCHTLKSYQGTTGPDGKPRLGLKAYTLSEQLQGRMGFSAIPERQKALYGDGHAADEENPHLGEDPMLPLEANPGLLGTSKACLGCHDRRSNAHGVPLCSTGDEITESQSFINCQSCHMPVHDGKADHAMGGGHSVAMLRRGGVLELKTETTEKAEIRATLSLYNGQPHALPTGAPFRTLFIKLLAYDRQGEIVWQNYRETPSEDPQALLTYTLVNEAGEAVPPPKATQPGEDTRLKPGETRSLSYTLPAAEVDLLRAEVYYSLLWPRLLERFADKLPEEVLTPKLVWFAETRP